MPLFSPISGVAFQCTAIRFLVDSFVENIRMRTSDSPQSSTYVTAQRIPSNVGIPRADRTNLLTYDAHRLPHSVQLPPSSCRPYRDVRSLFEVVVDTMSTPSTPRCVYKGLTKCQLTLLLRLRIRSALTSDWLFKTGIVSSTPMPLLSAPWDN